MNEEAIKSRIEEFGTVPTIRRQSTVDALFAINALSDSGLPVAEVTLTTPSEIAAISESLLATILN
jgi:2-keto-3-deoxy-6-phosphogluconate aldolase